MKYNTNLCNIKHNNLTYTYKIRNKTKHLNPENNKIYLQQ